MSISEIMVERARMPREWTKYVEAIAKAVREVLPEARVYVFGSAVSGRAVGSSDVDILVVAEKLPKSHLERARIKALVEERCGLPHYHPFEIHLATEEEAEPFLRRGKVIEL